MVAWAAQWVDGGGQAAATGLIPGWPAAQLRLNRRAMMRWHDRCQSQTPAQMKVIAMTTKPRRSFTRRLTAPFRAFRHLNWDPAGLGEAIAPSSRFLQPRPQADLTEAKRVHPASAGKVPAVV
jgi:hypothetical protein